MSQTGVHNQLLLWTGKPFIPGPYNFPSASPKHRTPRCGTDSNLALVKAILLEIHCVCVYVPRYRYIDIDIDDIDIDGFLFSKIV